MADTKEPTLCPVHGPGVPLLDRPDDGMGGLCAVPVPSTWPGEAPGTMEPCCERATGPGATQAVEAMAEVAVVRKALQVSEDRSDGRQKMICELAAERDQAREERDTAVFKKYAATAALTALRAAVIRATSGIDEPMRSAEMRALLPNLRRNLMDASDAAGRMAADDKLRDCEVEKLRARVAELGREVASSREIVEAFSDD